MRKLIAQIINNKNAARTYLIWSWGGKYRTVIKDLW